MKEFLLSTTRLQLRAFQLADANGFFLLNNDPLVLRHTGDVPFVDEAAAADFISRYDHYQNYGYGRWAIILRATGQFIGFCGLKYHPDQHFVDLGFRLQRQYWGQGLATEAARACLDYAFKDLRLNRIVGRVQRGNQASSRVLEKIGMKLVNSFDFEGTPGYWYEIERPSD